MTVKLVNREELEKKIIEQVDKISYTKGYISMVDLLMGLGYLSQKDYEAWRMKRVEYLENVCKTNLKRLTFINSVMKWHAHDLNMTKSKTVYMSYGKGKKIRLRFSKSNINKIEESYATHYVLPIKKREKLEKKEL